MNKLFTLCLTLISINALAGKKTCIDFYRETVSLDYLEKEAQVTKSAIGLALVTSASAMAAGYFYIKAQYPLQGGMENLVTGASTTGGSLGGLAASGVIALALPNGYTLTQDISNLDNDAYMGEGKTLESFARELNNKKDSESGRAKFANRSSLRAQKAVADVINDNPAICSAEIPGLVKKNIVAAASLRYDQMGR